ncbi:MAG: YidB family protein [Asticcacaulis sp.]
MLNNFLGGKGGFDLGAIGDLLGNGGIQTILQQLSQGGLGEVVQSWIGNGENLPVSAEQLQNILGNEQLTQLASRFGIDPSQIASLLPGVIDQLTPNGQLPEGGIADALGGLLGGKGIDAGAVGNLLGGLFKR